MKKGIDLSHHNGTIDFQRVKASGVEFVVLREGYRKEIDRKFEEYVKGCIKAGIPILGVYHFLYAKTEKEAVEEARSCIENIKRVGLGPKDFYYWIFSDFEYDTVKKAAKEGVLLGSRECNLFTYKFCEEIRKEDYKVGIYTNDDYYKNMYDKDILESYPIWLADYKDGPDYNCVMQQYTSKGKIPGISGYVDLNYFYGPNFKMEEKKMYSRNEVVRLAESWVGKNEKDGSYKSIIDIYNSVGPFPRNTKIQYGWAWCACTWSALAKKLGYTEIMPVEISCGYLINEAKRMGCWQENDGYVPKPGDAVVYDWDDSGKGDNTGWPDHVGLVEYVNEKAGYFTTIEGNYKDSVKKRTVSINGKFIRGFIVPKYDEDKTVIYENVGTSKDIEIVAMEVIAGVWGDGDSRKESLKRNGLNPEEIQARVNEILNGSAAKPSEPIQNQNQPYEKEVMCTCYARSKNIVLRGTWKTCSNSYLRNDAGTNKKALAIIPPGTNVQCYGNYTKVTSGVKWLLIEVVLDGVKYTGFTSEKCLLKVK